MPSNQLVVITPAFQEWPNLIQMAPRMVETLERYGPGSRWVVVVEPDPPAELVSTLVASSPSHICVVARSLNESSFGAAMQLGVDQINTEDEIAIFMDGDGSHDPARIPLLWAAATASCNAESPDVVIASRYVRGGKSDNALPLKIMSLAANLVFRIVFRIRAKDLSTNFKLYRARLLHRARLSSSNFEAVEELLLIARFRNGGRLTIVEIPDHFHERNLGVSKRKLGQFVGSYLIAIFRLGRQVKRNAKLDGK